MPHDELTNDEGTNDGGTKPDGVFTTLALLPNGESRSLQAPAGWRLMEVLRDYGLPIRAECGGACACATCHVHVAGAGRLPLSAPLSDVTRADIARLGGAALAIRFDTFSDGRGFTAARHAACSGLAARPLTDPGSVGPEPGSPGPPAGVTPGVTPGLTPGPALSGQFVSPLPLLP